MNHYMISDFTHPLFQTAFQAYFEEFKIEVDDWDALFANMNEQKGNLAYLLKNEEKEIIGFIQFRIESLSNWFFTETAGFIREFWISKHYRNKGLGSTLIAACETFFSENKITKVLLTSHTAEIFYLRQHYKIDSSYIALNKDPVFSKNL